MGSDPGHLNCTVMSDVVEMPGKLCTVSRTGEAVSNGAVDGLNEISTESGGLLKVKADGNLRSIETDGILSMGVTVLVLSEDGTRTVI